MSSKSIHLFLYLLLISTLSIAQEALPLTWQNIFTKNYGARQAVLSPDGSMVAITASTPTQSGIFLKKIGSPESPQFWIAGSNPTWFSDSHKVVFTSQGDLWTIEVGHTNPKRLTNDKTGERAPQPAPDGTKVAFYSGRSGYQDIWTVQADGSGDLQQVTQKAMAADDFRFAPS